VYAPTEEKGDDSEDSFYEELEQILNYFSLYLSKNMLRDFNAKLVRKDVLKATIANESLHQVSNDNGVRIVIFATSKI
jgi:hypothetical protein